LGLSIIFAYYRWAMPTAMLLRPVGADQVNCGRWM